MRRWLLRRPDIADRLLLHVLVDVIRTPVEYLETHQMQVDRMRVLGEVHQVPHLGTTQLYPFRHRLVPALAVEQHQHRRRDTIAVFIQRQLTRLRGASLGEPHHIP